MIEFDAVKEVLDREIEAAEAARAKMAEIVAGKVDPADVVEIACEWKATLLVIDALRGYISLTEEMGGEYVEYAARKLLGDMIFLDASWDCPPPDSRSRKIASERLARLLC
ncbi:MAG: hypothetical protein N2111_14430 [Candidatus Sumerlaeaceae bacterium]|nr:hypothetical protein [Candidatus Sumerlaeaceae bacterium]